MLKNEPNLFEIEYKKSFPFVQVSLKNFFAIFLEAVFIGILAFIMETVVDMIYVKYIITKVYYVDHLFQCMR